MMALPKMIQHQMLNWGNLCAGATILVAILSACVM
jgi:hypothetical protein